jgi:hypothetical protein
LRGYENRVLRRIFGPKRKEVAGGWRKLHNLYNSPDTRVIKSRRMRWVGHVAHIGEMRCIPNFYWKTRREETTLKT